MGQLFLASHDRLPMKFVVKVLSPALICLESLEQFRHEATVLAGLQHPNIVQLVDFNWTDSGLPFLVMEYLPGTDLATGFEAQRARGFAHLMALLGQIAAGLFAAHCRCIVHRDLKPKNIMVIPCEGRRDLVKLIDFGVSTIEAGQSGDSDGDGNGNESGMIAGTPEFMSPEQAVGRAHEVGPASDQFSFAVLAYLLLSGRLPWTASSPREVLEQVVHVDPEPLSEGMASVEAVLLRGMAKDPAKRFLSSLGFARALRRAMFADGLLPERLAASAVPLSPPQQELSLAPPSDGEVVMSATSAEVMASTSSSAEPEASDAAPPETVRIGWFQRLRGYWRWTPVLIGASLGAMLGLSAPLFVDSTAAGLCRRVSLNASRAVAAVVEQGRAVWGHFSSVRPPGPGTGLERP
jgi:serine/threonine protein kinase